MGWMNDTNALLSATMRGNLSFTYAPSKTADLPVQFNQSLHRLLE